MNILAVDDEPIVLWSLMKNLEEIFCNPQDNVQGFDEVDDVFKHLEWMKDEPLDYAFLDVKLRGMTGVELAKRLREEKPKVKIIFCTAYSDYAMDAFQVHAVGYLLKPITQEMIRKTLGELNTLLTQEEPIDHRLHIHTFGNFVAFVDYQNLNWEREKAKELLALLIDRRGAALTNAEIAMTLWGDDSKAKQVTTIVSSLRKTLKQAGVEDALVRSRNQSAVDPSKIHCDFYEFLKGDIKAINSYRGEYMNNYEWAEFTNAKLMENPKNPIMRMLEEQAEKMEESVDADNEEIENGEL